MPQSVGNSCFLNSVRLTSKYVVQTLFFIHGGRVVNPHRRLFFVHDGQKLLLTSGYFPPSVDKYGAQTLRFVQEINLHIVGLLTYSVPTTIDRSTMIDRQTEIDRQSETDI